MYFTAASVIMFIVLNYYPYPNHKHRIQYRDKLREIIQMQPEKLTECKFTKLALNDTTESYHNRYNTDTDIRPHFIFGKLDLYQDSHEFDGAQKVSNIVHQIYHIGNLSVVYQVRYQQHAFQRMRAI